MKIEEGLTWTLPGRHSPPAAQLPSLALAQNTAQDMAQRQPTYLFVKIKRGVHPHLLLAHGRQQHAVLLFSSLAVDPSFIDGVTRLALEPYKSLDKPWLDLLLPLLNFCPRPNPSPCGLRPSPPMETTPGLAVTTNVTADLDLLFLQKESSRHARNHRRRTHLLRRRHQAIPATATSPCLSDMPVVLTVSSRTY
jgi:hypothetical protein